MARPSDGALFSKLIESITSYRSPASLLTSGLAAESAQDESRELEPVGRKIKVDQFFGYGETAVLRIGRSGVPNSAPSGMNLLPNTGSLGGERHDFGTLAFFQILQANLHSVPELEGVSIGASTSRQLSESHRFG